MHGKLSSTPSAGASTPENTAANSQNDMVSGESWRAKFVLSSSQKLLRAVALVIAARFFRTSAANKPLDKAQEKWAGLCNFNRKKLIL